MKIVCTIQSGENDREKLCQAGGDLVCGEAGRARIRPGPPAPGRCFAALGLRCTAGRCDAEVVDEARASGQMAPSRTVVYG